MSIKPIDFQVMLPKAPEVAKISNDAQHRMDALQQQQASAVQQNAQNSTKTVHSKDKANEAAIHEKQQKDKEEKGKGKKKGKYNYNSSKKAELQEKTSTIDVKI
ncbi:hypothetical protein DFR58_113124 [Anaerobacterium chartisolvens]|uniref:Uncharacterized protein n=1 Tax=Anaerobacterium chartisolvens TaxID=1297424 RepID=A0A369B1J3_9FIRM|nr:hypothetical protein [Anaerobacterium chartisolvens]RCX15542.1 hypothetical protein DFR58_113124 [Anaerobacterium chartisolvens]